MSMQDRRHGEMFMEPVLSHAIIQVSRELMEDSVAFGLGNVVEEIHQQMEEFNALPEEEKARRRAEAEERYRKEAEEREAHRCPTCGRLPEEYDDND